MIRKVLINKSYALLLLRQKMKISLYPSNKALFKNSPLYSFKFCYQFSNSGKVGSKQNIIDVGNQLYSTYKWSDEFVKRMQKKTMELYQQQDFENCLILHEFFLQKIKQKQGINHNFYVFKLYLGISICASLRNFGRCQNWLKILEQLVLKYPLLGRDPTDKTHIQFNLGMLFMEARNKKQALKWFQLFMNKYKDFDVSTEVSQKQRLYTYLYMTDCLGSTNRNEQAAVYSKKAFDLVQKQQTKDVQKNVLISVIYNYGVAKLQIGDREEALKAFDITQKNFDWNDPNTFDLVLKISLSYITKGLSERTKLLFQQFQKQYESKKHIKEYQRVYEQSLSMRVGIYFFLQKYDILYKALKNQQQKKGSEDELDISMYILFALCQIKLGNKQGADIFFQKSLTLAQSIKNHSPNFQPQKEYDLFIQVQKQLIGQLNSPQKQIINQIKQILMKMQMKMKNKN